MVGEAVFSACACGCGLHAMLRAAAGGQERAAEAKEGGALRGEVPRTEQRDGGQSDAAAAEGGSAGTDFRTDTGARLLMQFNVST